MLGWRDAAASPARSSRARPEGMRRSILHPPESASRRWKEAGRGDLTSRLSANGVSGKTTALGHVPAATAEIGAAGWGDPQQCFEGPRVI